MKTPFVIAASLFGVLSATTTSAAPDLSVRARLNADNRLIVDVANRGDATVPAGVGGVSIYIDGRIRGSYAFRNLSDTSFRAPGGLISIPTNFRLGGALRRVSVVVDPANEIAEAREDHNSYSVTLNPPPIPGPDFIVSDMDVESGNLVFRIRNIGDQAAPASLSSRVRIIVDEIVAADLTPSLGGLAVGAERIVRPSPAIPITGRQETRILLNMNNFFDETDKTNNVREEILPSPSIIIYALWLLHPQISDAMRWNGVSYPDWSAAQKNQLADAIREIENGFNPGLTTPPALNADNRVSAADAWTIYIHHVAHSLWLERNSKVPWRLIDMSPDNLRLLLDGENLITRVVDGSYYYNSLQEGALTVWNPQISYQFMTNLGLLKSTHRDTIFAFTDWARAHVRHISGADDRSVVYGYPGMPPADRILYPLEGQGQIANGCWGMSPLWIAALRGVNIPAQFGTVVYSGGLHARPIFPTIGMGLGHGDDPYTSTYASTGNPIPIADIFWSLSDINTLLLSPTPECPGGSCISPEEQASFNAAAFSMNVVTGATGDYLLSRYARGGADDLRNALIGPTRDHAHFLHRPLLTTAEQDAVIALVEAELRSLGGGSIAAGVDIVDARSVEHSFHRLRRPIHP